MIKRLVMSAITKNYLALAAKERLIFTKLCKKIIMIEICALAA